MPINIKNELKSVKQRNYLNKDFDGFKSDLLSYAKTYYGDKIKDFSDGSVPSMFLELASYTGDVMSLYLDHQFLELFHDSAVEVQNIEQHIKSAGVSIVGASPAVVKVLFYIEVPAVRSGATFIPQPESLPIIHQGSVCAATNGIRFELTQDLDFSELDEDENYKAQIKVGTTNQDGSPATFLMNLSGVCVSGFTRTETFVIPNEFIAFRRINLSSNDITEIISVTDSEGNNFYEVESLTNDTVFRGSRNLGSDYRQVPMTLEVIPAPYRYLRQMNLGTRITTLVFGGGRADSLDNDIIPDPSEFAIPLYGKTTFSSFSIDPNNLLNTRTLGVSPQATTITVQYRYGGGLSHNVSGDSVTTPTKLLMTFPGEPNAILASQVRSSLSVKNVESAKGGENAPTIDELKTRIPSARNSQSRVVSVEDLLSRVYMMPSNFGRVFRASVGSNPDNPLATQLFIVSRDSDGNLTTSPDTLKENLLVYLNRYRLISDAVDILDAKIINVSIEFEIATEATSNRNIVVQNVISKLQKYLDIKNFQIDQPIKISDIQNIIFNTPSVVSVTDIKIKNLFSSYKGRSYSNHIFDINSNTIKGFIFPPQGGIFNIKYSNFDILGNAI